MFTVNDPPTFTAGASPIVVDADSALYNASWASNISAGPREDQQLTLRIVCGDNAASLFAEGPSIAEDGMLSFAPKPFKSGTAECTVVLKEAGNEGLQATEPLSILITDGECSSREQKHG
jgi:hypothetical protein